MVALGTSEMPSWGDFVDDSEPAGNITSNSVGTQTDLNATEALEEDNERIKPEVSVVEDATLAKMSLRVVKRSFESFSSFTVLMAVFNMVAVAVPVGGAAKLTKFDCFTLTLMKLRLNASNYDLGFRFNMSESTVSRVFTKWIEAMDIRLLFLVLWPDKESIQKTMPFCFQPHYDLNVTSIIDCFELFIEKPSNLLAKACTWSQYKHYNTAKVLHHKESSVLSQMDGAEGCLTSTLLSIPAT